MIKKKVLFLLILILLSCVPENTNNSSDFIFQTNGNIHGPVKTIIISYKDSLYYNPNNDNMTLRIEYSSDGKLNTSQFFCVDIDNYRLSKITAQYSYKNSALKTVNYYKDGKKLLLTDIVTSNDETHLYQKIYNNIWDNYIIDYDWRFLFDLISFDNKSQVVPRFCYRIKLSESGWDALLLNKNKKELYRINYEMHNDIKNYFIDDLYLKVFRKIELKFINGNLIQSSFYVTENQHDFETEDLMTMTKYEYISFDKYGNWLECVEENFGVKQKISREIEYYKVEPEAVMRGSHARMSPEFHSVVPRRATPDIAVVGK